jgi:hypothetical protein
MQQNKVVQKLSNHIKAVPYSIDKEHFIMAIQEIERLQNIVDSHNNTSYNLRGVPDA